MRQKNLDLKIDGDVNAPVNYTIVDMNNLVGAVFLGLIAIILLIALLAGRRRAFHHRRGRFHPMHPQHKYNPIRID